ncbi:unnamed protein product, partial [Polarella glacialis]
DMGGCGTKSQEEQPVLAAYDDGAGLCMHGLPNMEQFPRKFSGSPDWQGKRYCLSSMIDRGLSGGDMKTGTFLFGDFQDEKACCLAWRITKEADYNMDPQLLLTFHAELTANRSFFQAETLVDEAISGVFLGQAVGDGEMTAADSLVRMGQLLCRWAVAQSPPFPICVGVHIGQLLCLNLPNSNSRRSFYGEAVS